MTEQHRIESINSLEPTKESRAILYDGRYDIYPIYNIPLEYLIYNPHNGRIRSLTKSHESQHGPLNPQIERHKIIIEQFLYDSAKGKNDKTIESIRNIGQQEHGIVTKDGVIIDGNRRAMLLNLINRSSDRKLTFKAIILPDTLIDKRQQIITLETSYQMGVDSKVDYNPIEKYIRCKELREFFSVEEIGEKMAETPRQIEEWLSNLDLMDEYLSFLSTPGTYTRLEKREGHFVDLYKYLKTYNNNQSLKNIVDWEYSLDDVSKLKEAYFTYIRLGIPVARSRVIARPANRNSFFCYGDIWIDFIKEHDSVTQNVDEINFESLKQQFSEINHSVLINKVDEKWKDVVEKKLDDILHYYEGVLSDRQNLLVPLRLLKRAKNTLYQIDEKVLKAEMNQEKLQLIIDIETKIDLFKSL